MLTSNKNLIPLLCIRPMRLFLSAETVRRVRIVLLRATHLPFVMLIWAYESSQGQRRRPTTQLPPLATARGHGPSALEPHVNRCQDPHHPSVVEVYRPGPGIERTSVEQQDLDLGESGSTERGTQLADVIDAVERLREQVARVTTTLAAQQRAES